MGLVLDPDHSWQGGRTELDGGKMDGFLKAACDTLSIGYYAQEDLPFTPHVAHRRRTLATFNEKTGVHHVKLTVLGGLVALEGYGLSVRTG